MLGDVVAGGEVVGGVATAKWQSWVLYLVFGSRRTGSRRSGSWRSGSGRESVGEVEFVGVLLEPVALVIQLSWSQFVLELGVRFGFRQFVASGLEL